ncbi:DUF6346 domain-containing protein [Salinispora fenicalii]|uniref:DUF6346 domain-containing protein n=1 Tax=Salinispora fenicalii TaxID=1137263 RepID=UPI0037CB96BD
MENAAVNAKTWVERVVEVLRNLALSALIAVITATIALGAKTIESSYHGTGLGTSDIRKNGLAAAKSCLRVGPISVYGFGYWWSCSVRVAMEDGRILEIDTRASMLRPGERDVPMVESCQKNRPSKCVYTRPGNYAIAFVVQLLRVIAAVTVVFGAAAAGGVALFALLGGRRKRSSAE